MEKKIVSFRALDKVKESGRASSTLRQKSEAVVGNHELLTASKLKRLQSEEEGVGRQARRTGETLLSRVQLSAKDLVRDGRSANKS